MADPELAKDMTAEQEEFTTKYEYLSHRFFKFNNSQLPSSARNIHFICLLCPRKTLIACSKKNTANLRMHIERQHGQHLEVSQLWNSKWNEVFMCIVIWFNCDTKIYKFKIMHQNCFLGIWRPDREPEESTSDPRDSLDTSREGTSSRSCSIRDWSKRTLRRVQVWRCYSTFYRWQNSSS